MTNFQQAQEQDGSEKDKKPSILGTIALTVLLIICIDCLGAILVTPMFFNGMITLEMFELPHNEFIEQVGIFGMSILQLASLISTIICLYIIFKSDRLLFKSMGFQFHGYKKDLFIGAFAGIAIISSCFFMLFKTSYISYSIQDFTQVPWLSSIALFLFVALQEEILCRGFIQGRLMKSTNAFIALFISSIIFMLMHLGNDNWTVVSLLNLFLAGVTFGIYYLHTKNLWFPIALHFTWNFFQGTVFGFEVSGGKMDSWLVITKSNNPLINGGDFGLEGSLLVTAFELLVITLIHLKFTMNKTIPDTETSISECSPFNSQQLMIK